MTKRSLHTLTAALVRATSQFKAGMESAERVCAAKAKKFARECAKLEMKRPE